MASSQFSRLPLSMPVIPIRPLALPTSSMDRLSPPALMAPVSRSPSPMLSDEEMQSDSGLVPTFAQVDITSMQEVKDTKKRRRTTPEELACLEASFKSNPLPDFLSRKSLAEKLKMTPRAVQIWFQNRRQKEKRLPTAERVLAKLPSPSEYSNYSLRDLPAPAPVPAVIKPVVEERDYDQAELLKLPCVSTIAFGDRPIMLRSLSAPIPSSSTTFLSPNDASNNKPKARPAIRRQTSVTYLTDDDTGHASLPPLKLEDQTSPKTKPPHPPMPSLKRARSAFAYIGHTHPSQSLYLDDDDDDIPEGAKPEHSPGSDATTALCRKRAKLLQEGHLKTLSIDTKGSNPFLFSMSSDSSPISAEAGDFGGKLSLGFLLQAAKNSSPAAKAKAKGMRGVKAVDAVERMDEAEVSTDDETVQRAVKAGGKGDQSFSSVSSEADESAEEAALLLALGGR